MTAASAVVRTTADFAAWAASHARGVTYAGPDPHYGIGLEGVLPGYGIVCFDDTPAATVLRGAGVAVFCPGAAEPIPTDVAAAGREDADALPALGAAPDRDPSSEPRGTPALMARADVRRWLAARAAGLDGPLPLLVFKPSHRLEALSAAAGWRLLAAPAALARRFENKAAFRALADELGLAQPPGRIVERADMRYGALAAALGPRLVVQAPYGYAGMQSHVVADDDALAAALAGSRSPTWRVAALVDGLPLSVNACATARGVAVGAPFLQLTGLPAVTPYPLGSCGQDWSVMAALDVDVDGVADIARRLGVAMAAAGFRGVFGVDVVQARDGRLLAIEVNPRLIASIALYTQLELADGRLPLLARHLLAHLDPEADQAPLDAGAGPLAGGQVVAHHVGGAPFRAAQGVAAGIWRVPSAPPPPRPVIRPAVRIDGVGAGEALVLPPAPGRDVAFGQAYARLQFAGRGPARPDGALDAGVDALLRRVAEVVGVTGGSGAGRDTGRAGRRTGR